jgi:hypothetical protein
MKTAQNELQIIVPVIVILFSSIEVAGSNPCWTWLTWLCAFCLYTEFNLFGPERDEDGSWRKLHNDELHSLYSSPNIVSVIKSGRMRWTGHVARMGEGRGVDRVLVGRP